MQGQQIQDQLQNLKLLNSPKQLQRKLQLVQREQEKQKQKQLQKQQQIHHNFFHFLFCENIFKHLQLIKNSFQVCPAET